MSIGGDWDFPLTSPVPPVHLLNWFLRGYLKCQFVGLGISQDWQLISRGGRAVFLHQSASPSSRPLSYFCLTQSCLSFRASLLSSCSHTNTPDRQQLQESKHQQWTKALQLPAAMLALSLLVLGLLTQVAPASCQQGSTGQGYLGCREERAGWKQ